MTANNAETLLFGALAGLGIAHLPTWLISDYLLRGELLPLFCENGLPEAETSGIYALRLEHETNSRSRLLLEFLKSRFSPVPPLGPGTAQRAALVENALTDSALDFHPERFQGPA